MASPHQRAALADPAHRRHAGPYERRFGLATLVVYTAGTEHASIPIEGLSHETALAFRDALLARGAAPPCSRRRRRCRLTPPIGPSGDGGWQRLHPLTLVFARRRAPLRAARAASCRRWSPSSSRAAALRPAAGRTSKAGCSCRPACCSLFELVQYFTLAYRFDPHEIVIARGLIWKRERHIPYARVQNIELVQHAAHRLAGVAVVRLDTGTGAGAEGELSVLSLDAVAELREAVRVGRHGEAAAAARARGATRRTSSSRSTCASCCCTACSPPAAGW